MDLGFLAQADAATIQLEKAKRALESAKAELESAKKAYDEILAQADEMGVPKAKLRKLTEDRIQALFEIGLIDFAEAPPAKPKRARSKSSSKTFEEKLAVEETFSTSEEAVPNEGD